ncbi:hypothetical protein [Endozoicomonas sp. ALB032]|uniref:hypothetical protein n=1 Tax=Endozoicomonas sp. ALB032 TaxID=3403082 RepID=UPI003BB5E0BC
MDLEQSTGFKKQNFFIKNDRRTFSGNQSEIIEKNGYAGQDFLHNHKPCNYGVKTPLIESISWQRLYATNLLIAYELILTIKDTPLNSSDYSWLPLEVIVSWVLINYWSPDSPVFKPIELQSASLLTQEDQPFAIITTMFGFGHNSPQYPSPESTGQQAPQATNNPTGYFTHLLCSDSGNGNEDPKQDSHTLGLNCFVNSCHGVCQLRPASDSSGPSESTLNSEKNSTDNTEASAGCISDFDSVTARDSQPRTHQPGDMQLPGNVSATSDDLIIISGLLNLGKSQSPPHLFRTDKVQSKNSSGQRICDVTVVGQDGQPQPCGTVCKSAKTLSSHKSGLHRGQQTCHLKVVAEDGQHRPCWTVWKNARALDYHKRKEHTGQQTCDVSVIRQDGQQRPCGTVCNNAQALNDHKRRHHSKQQTCDVAVFGQDGQPQPCGAVSKSAKALTDHKRRQHGRQRICNITVVGANGQRRPCGKVFKDASALSHHKRKEHTGQQTCNLTVVGLNGQPRLCAKLCKNAKALSDHKRIHRKHKPADRGLDDGLGHKEGKVSK